MNLVRSVCLLVVLAVWGTARADNVVIVAGRDTSLYEELPTHSNGGGPTLFSGITSGIAGPIAIRRALLIYDVAGNIPAGSTINSVQVQLRQEQPGTGDADTRVFTLHPLFVSWGEGTAGTGMGPFGGAGFPTLPDGTAATWSHRFFNTTSWAMPGGDFGTLASGTASSPPEFNIPITFASMPGLVADVQSWLDHPRDNFGWALIGDELAGLPPSVRRFSSREAADPTVRPRLVVDFTPAGGVVVPEPSTWTLLGLGTLSLLVFRRRLRKPTA
ncbi:MAG: DNRLRE domain-containing protein [Gemmataceae bacterium]|nr:DNRLRE domain-containing protein [Gemmataceae bacterium]